MTKAFLKCQMNEHDSSQARRTHKTNDAHLMSGTVGKEIVIFEGSKLGMSIPSLCDFTDAAVASSDPAHNSH